VGIYGNSAFSAFYRADLAAFPMEFSQTVSYIWMQQAFFGAFYELVFLKQRFLALLQAVELRMNCRARWTYMGCGFANLLQTGCQKPCSGAFLF
jgi:hypothetical protein